VTTARLSSRFRVVLRTSLGFAGLGIGSSVCGAAVSGLMLTLQGLPGVFGQHGYALLVSSLSYVAAALLVGSLWTALLQRRTVVWFLLGRPPSYDEARRALRLPIDTAVVSGTLWLLGTVLLGTLTVAFGSGWNAIGVTLTIGIGGLFTVGLTYLAAEWVARPVMSLALAVAPPIEGKLPTTVLARLLITWALASGMPLLAVLAVVAPPDFSNRSPTASLLVLPVIGLVIGAAATALLARAVATPLRGLRFALEQIARGRNDVSVPVDDASEIGTLQTSVNDLAAGLREQERMRDLFGRHVGTDVARHALEHGAALSGEVREVTALFVDVVDSTVLAYQLSPEELVDKLNRLFSSVVEAVSTHGGLVNKFQGDTALCVFGAPTRLANSASAALRAARSIRDSVVASGELDLGIGVAAGPVFAGQLGTSSRLEYTVIGDAVNEAARLTGNAKELPGRILVSDAVIEACSPAERQYWQTHERIQLRGREADTVTWQEARANGAGFSRGSSPRDRANEAE